MPQLHLYLPEEIAGRVRRRAEARGVSVSRILAEIVTREFGAHDWPEGFFEEVVGGWAGEPLERPPQGAWERRDDL